MREKCFREIEEYKNLRQDLRYVLRWGVEEARGKEEGEKLGQGKPCQPHKTSTFVPGRISSHWRV